MNKKFLALTVMWLTCCAAVKGHAEDFFQDEGGLRWHVVETFSRETLPEGQVNRIYSMSLEDSDASPIDGLLMTKTPEGRLRLLIFKGDIAYASHDGLEDINRELDELVESHKISGKLRSHLNNIN